MKATFMAMVLGSAVAGMLTGCSSDELVTPAELTQSEEELAAQEALQVENEEKLHALEQQQK